MTEYRFDLWPVMEKWYREKYGRKGRLSFLYAKDVREWLSLNGYSSEMSSDDLIYYQPIWSILRDHIIKTHGKTCEVCGRDVSGEYDIENAGKYRAEVDHIFPIALGGLEFDINNLRVTCKECNTKNRPNKALRLYFDPKQEKLIKEDVK